MALSSLTYYSNSIVGNMQVGADVDVHRVDTAPKYPVGQGFTRADGNVFRYCHIGTATNAGKLVGPTTASAGLTYTGGKVIAPTSAVQVAAEAPIYPGQVGSHFVQITIAGIAANKYYGSYLVTTGGTGLGETYRIIGNTATDSVASGDVRIQLADAIKTAFTIGTGVIITSSMYTDLAATTTSASQATGVLMATTTSTLLWGWVCTHGQVGCAEDATTSVINAVAVTAGQQVVPSTNTAGSYMQFSAQSTQLGIVGAVPIVGYVVTPAGASTRQGVIYLQLE